MKDRLNLTVEEGLKQKAEAQNLNISEAVEQVLKEKTKDPDKSTLILQVEKYGISIIPNNYVVGRLRNAPVASIEGVGTKITGIFDNGTETYHPNLHQALIQLSKRLLIDKLKKECKERR